MASVQEPQQVNRRQVVMAGALKWLLGAAGTGVIGNFTYERLTKKEVHVDLLDLYPSFSKTQLVPGSHHPDEGFHPDVYDAMCGMATLVGQGPTTSTSFGALPTPNLTGDLLLLGGPISNELSCRLHGHSYTNRKITPLPENRSGFRWHFYYPEPVPMEHAYSRYVSGKRDPKWRKAIIDTKLPVSANEIDSRCEDDGSISNDYLLITVQPNTFAPGSGTSIVEVADLQGQGDKAFSTLFANEAARHELKAELRFTKYFQALYEVPVVHDSKAATTSPGTPRLVGVSPLGS